MPERRTVQKARQAKRRGKSPSTQAGAFVEEEIRHVRQGKHGARSAKQAIAIGLSKARRAGVRLPPPKRGRAAPGTRKQAARDSARAASGRRPSAKRSQTSSRALKREGRQAGSRAALSRQARKASTGRRKPTKGRRTGGARSGKRRSKRSG